MGITLKSHFKMKSKHPIFLNKDLGMWTHMEFGCAKEAFIQFTLGWLCEYFLRRGLSSMWPLLMGTERPELRLYELMPSMLVAVYCGLMSAIIVLLQDIF